MYYGGGFSTALLMSAQPATRAARLPVLALLLGNWGAEQWLMGALQRHLIADSAGVVHAAVPHPKLLSDALRWLRHLRLIANRQVTAADNDPLVTLW